MARGGIGTYATGYAGGSGGVRRDAEVTAANRAVGSGGDVTEALGRVQNAGGGDIKVSGEKLDAVLGNTPRGVAQAEDGSIIVQNSRFGGEGVSVIKPNGETTTAPNATVSVSPSGVQSVQIGKLNYVIARTRVDVTKNQKDGVVSVTLPPSLRGARFDKAGNVNGWSINPKAIPNKEIRAAAYRLMGKDGVLRIPAGSPLAKRLEGDMSKAGYGRSTIQKVNEAFAETGTVYRAGDDAAGRTAAGLERKPKENA
jgi:hypothetical protein